MPLPASGIVMGAGFVKVKAVPHGGGVPEGVGVGAAPITVALKSLNCGPVVLVANPDHIPVRPAPAKTVLVTAILWMPFHLTVIVVSFIFCLRKRVPPRVSKSEPVRAKEPRVVNVPPW